jgi:hypothetical protein
VTSADADGAAGPGAAAGGCSEIGSALIFSPTTLVPPMMASALTGAIRGGLAVQGETQRNSITPHGRPAGTAARYFVNSPLS